MKNQAFLEHVDHNRKAAIYAAERDGKLRNFAYHEELGECRETFARLVQDVQQGEIGVILTPDAACLSIETSPGWMETLIQVVKQHQVLIGDHSHDLVYDLREQEDEAQFRGLYPQGEYEKARSAPRPLLDAIAPYGITEQEGWCPVPPERKDWLARTQRQEDAMAEQTTAAMKHLQGSLPRGPHVRVILPGSGGVRGKKRRKRGGRNA